MKKKLLLLSLLATSGIYTMQCLDEKDIAKIKDYLVEFHKPTYSNGSNIPDVSKLQKNDIGLIAKMDSFGLDRYWSFQNNDHVKELVQGVRNGGGESISWYYLKESDNINILTLDQWAKKN
jgi:hypothetical protein